MSRTIKINILDWLEEKFGEVENAPHPDVRLNCPFCFDTKKRLYVAVEDYRDIRKGWAWCHNEQRRYNFFEMFRDIENITDSEAFQRLFDQGSETPYGESDQALREYFDDRQKVVKSTQEVPVVWPSGYHPMWNLEQKDWERTVPPYFLKRKITKKICDKYYLGYCEYGDFANRLIIPIYQNNHLVGYQGRSMIDSLVPKYKFMAGIKAGDYLFNLDNIPMWQDEVILAEGIFDVWGLGRAGFDNAVASFGKHLTDSGIKKLVDRFKLVYIMWDMDATVDIMNLAEKLDGLIEVRVTELNGKDPDESDPSEVRRAIDHAYKYSFDFKKNALISKIHGY